MHKHTYTHITSCHYKPGYALPIYQVRQKKKKKGKLVVNDEGRGDNAPSAPHTVVSWYANLVLLQEEGWMPPLPLRQSTPLQGPELCNCCSSQLFRVIIGNSRPNASNYEAVLGLAGGASLPLLIHTFMLLQGFPLAPAGSIFLSFRPSDLPPSHPRHSYSRTPYFVSYYPKKRIQILVALFYCYIT